MLNIEERNAKIEYLKENLSVEARYEQLAEECSELAQAALKYIRARGNGNPTPVLDLEAEMNVFEEAADVALCFAVNDIYYSHEMMDEKLERWVDRVKTFKEKSET